MLQVLAITAPIFIIIAMGYWAARLGLLTLEQIRGIGTFVITFALPALVIKALAQRPIGEVLNPHYLMAYAAASLASFSVGFYWFRRMRGADLQSSAIAAMGMSVSNSAYIGYPVAIMAAGAPAVVALALGMLVENLLMVPLALALAEIGRQPSASSLALVWGTLKRLGKNPLIVSISVGLCLSLLQVPLPVPVFKVIDMLSMASAPAALFVIGGVLYSTRVRGQLNEIALISTGKLLVHPLLLGLGFLIVGDIEPSMMLAGLILAAAPMMSVYPILGQRYGQEGRCAAALVLTTVSSFFTLSVLLIIAQW